MEVISEQISKNIRAVEQQIALAARRCGREPADVHLLVVTKGQSVERIAAAYQAGARLFGENYPEETLDKLAALTEPGQYEWHMIGHLQSRKVKIVADHFSMLHTLDSLSLAEKLSRHLSERGKTLPVLLEVNISGEQSKGGWPAWDDVTQMVFYAQVEQVLRFENLEVRGLMVMPPLFDDPEQTRPFFRKTRLLRDALAVRFSQTHWDALSMGTSADYAVAIEEGSTYVRIGTAIMGPRPPRA